MKKKIDPVRILIGTVFGGFILASLVGYVTSPAFPGLWLSDKDICARETADQPFISKEYYYVYFENCLLERNGKNIEVPSQGGPIEMEGSG